MKYSYDSWYKGVVIIYLGCADILNISQILFPTNTHKSAFVISGLMCVFMSLNFTDILSSICYSLVINSSFVYVQQQKIERKKF